MARTRYAKTISPRGGTLLTKWTLRPAHAPTFLATQSQTTQPGPTHFPVEAVERWIVVRPAIVAEVPTQNGGDHSCSVASGACMNRQTSWRNALSLRVSGVWRSSSVRVRGTPRVGRCNAVS